MNADPRKLKNKYWDKISTDFSKHLLSIFFYNKHVITDGSERTKIKIIKIIFLLSEKEIHLSIRKKALIQTENLKKQRHSTKKPQNDYPTVANILGWSNDITKPMWSNRFTTSQPSQ